MVFCSDNAGVVLTVYCTGKRMRSVEPILAPDWANESSYCLLIDPMKLHFWWRIANALAVIMLIVRSVFVAGMVYILRHEQEKGSLTETVLEISIARCDEGE